MPRLKSKGFNKNSDAETSINEADQNSDTGGSSSGGGVVSESGERDGETSNIFDYAKLADIIQQQISPVVLKLDRLECGQDDLSSQLRDSISSLQATVTKLSSELNDMKNKVEHLTKENRDIRKQMLILQNRDDEREQRCRGQSIRLYNISTPPSVSNNTLKLSKFLHDEVIKPVLLVAQQHGDLEAVPDHLGTIEFCHHLPQKARQPTASRGSAKPGPTQGDETPATEHQPPPIILRFTSRNLKVAFLKHRVAVFEKLSQKQELFDTNSKWFAQSDYTQARKECMRKLRKMSTLVDTQKVFMSGTTIKFYKLDEKSPTSVINVFGTSLADMICI